MKPWANEIEAHIQHWSARLGNLGWWPRYIYHFTDVQNAANILQNGHLYSRHKAQQLGLMTVDNASPTIIQQTSPEHYHYVRLYFRPRTPTQYRNEGIRPLNQRQYDGAHCPVPIFFCFDAFSLLAQPETLFSNGSMARPQVEYNDSRDFFFSIPFEKVYHNRRYSSSEKDIVFHRHAELLVPNQLPLQPTLKFIACRSVAERQTLLQLLPRGLANRWLPRIRLGQMGLFERRWTYIKEVVVVDGRIIVRFNPDTQTPGPFNVKISYLEDGADKPRDWSGTMDKLNDQLVFRPDGAKWGTLTLHLDDALAFKGIILFEETPF
ncbi:DarT ssDNA thymidine ADP-ribosyltransferase family protein [Anaerolineales bacterium HSG6]|nr:DarT ssDNA thymidine ADP-ribosyltransferase family protein [Anaerolineales bacterium HSG6]